LNFVLAFTRVQIARIECAGVAIITVQRAGAFALMEFVADRGQGTRISVITGRTFRQPGGHTTCAWNAAHRASTCWRLTHDLYTGETLAIGAGVGRSAEVSVFTRDAIIFEEIAAPRSRITDGLYTRVFWVAAVYWRTIRAGSGLAGFFTVAKVSIRTLCTVGHGQVADSGIRVAYVLSARVAVATGDHCSLAGPVGLTRVVDRAGVSIIASTF